MVENHIENELTLKQPEISRKDEIFKACPEYEEWQLIARHIAEFYKVTKEAISRLVGEDIKCVNRSPYVGGNDIKSIGESVEQDTYNFLEHIKESYVDLRDVGFEIGGGYGRYTGHVESYVESDFIDFIEDYLISQDLIGGYAKRIIEEHKFRSDRGYWISPQDAKYYVQGNYKVNIDTGYIYAPYIPIHNIKVNITPTRS